MDIETIKEAIKIVDSWQQKTEEKYAKAVTDDYRNMLAAQLNMLDDIERKLIDLMLK